MVRRGPKAARGAEKEEKDFPTTATNTFSMKATSILVPDPLPEFDEVKYTWLRHVILFAAKHSGFKWAWVLWPFKNYTTHILLKEGKEVQRLSVGCVINYL